MSDQPLPRPPLPDLSGGQRTIPAPIPPVVKIFALILLLVVMTPVLMYVAWLVTPSTAFTMLVVDKTSIDGSAIERASFYWVMKQHKLKRSNGRFYLPEVDYRGFLPLHDTAYLVTGLEGMDEGRLDSLASLLDAAYFVDTYGVSVDEWATKIPDEDPSRILYGGLAREDIHLLAKLKSDGKPIISEFNLLASPTPKSIRDRAQDLLGLQWTGWTGRYFTTMDTANDRDFPKWILRSYERQYETPWGYRHAGIIMVHLEGSLVVLEAGTYLRDPIPIIVTEKDIADYYGVSTEIPYPFWFDITFPRESNAVVSKFVIQTNQYGDSLLAFHNLPREFPAVICSKEPPLLYYFCMDAADNPVPPGIFACFKGIGWFDWLFYDAQDPMDRRVFYWKFYRPMMGQILEELKDQLPPPSQAEQ